MAETEGINQEDWETIYEHSIYRDTTICEKFGIIIRSFTAWIRCDRTPQPKNKLIMVKVMKHLKSGEKRMPKHPSYGYATEEQIKRLDKIGIGPERNTTLKAIEQQHKSLGKMK